MPAKPRTKARSRKPVERKPQHAAFVPGRLHIRFKADALRGAAATMARGVRAPRTMSASDPRVRELRAALPTQVTDPLRLLAEQFQRYNLEVDDLAGYVRHALAEDAPSGTSPALRRSCISAGPASVQRRRNSVGASRG